VEDYRLILTVPRQHARTRSVLCGAFTLVRSHHQVRGALSVTLRGPLRPDSSGWSSMVLADAQAIVERGRRPAQLEPWTPRPPPRWPAVCREHARIANRCCAGCAMWPACADQPRIGPPWWPKQLSLHRVDDRACASDRRLL